MGGHRGRIPVQGPRDAERRRHMERLRLSTARLAERRDFQRRLPGPETRDHRRRRSRSRGRAVRSDRDLERRRQDLVGHPAAAEHRNRFRAQLHGRRRQGQAEREGRSSSQAREARRGHPTRATRGSPCRAWPATGESRSEAPRPVGWSEPTGAFCGWTSSTASRGQMPERPPADRGASVKRGPARVA